jgi:hypothetical protein
MLQVLLLLDPSATTVDSVAAPIKAYLRNRKDTLRCIIEGLISDTDSDLCVVTCGRQPVSDSALTRFRYKELHAPHSGDPSRLSDTRDSSHVTVADDDIDSYRGESEAVFAAGAHSRAPVAAAVAPRSCVSLAAMKWLPPPRCAGPAAITASAASPPPQLLHSLIAIFGTTGTAHRSR